MVFLEGGRKKDLLRVISCCRVSHWLSDGLMLFLSRAGAGICSKVICHIFN